MKGFLEKLPDNSYLLRLGEDAEKYGDPWTFKLVVVDLGGGKCELKGLNEKPDRAMYEAISRTLTEHGFTEAFGERISGGRKRMMRFVEAKGR